MEKKVEIQKHHNDYKPGDVVDLPSGLADYLIGCGVATEKQEKPAKKTKGDPNAAKRETK